MKNSPKKNLTEADLISIINVFKDKLFRIAKRLLVSHEEAQDAVQEVVLKLWIQKDKMIYYTNVEAFAVTMTKNYCLDRLKSKQATNLQLIHSNYRDQHERLAKKIEARDSVSHLNRLMEQLPVQQKMIVQLRDIEQLEFAQIAEIMSMTEGAIRVALSRGRTTLKEALIKIHEYGT